MIVTSREYDCIVRAGAILLAAILSLLSLRVSDATAAIWDPFSGFVDVSAVQSRVSGEREETSRQEYNVAFSQKLGPWVDFRLATRYYRFDQELELLLGGYREEYQHSGELRWNHSRFQLMSSAFRREVQTPARGKILTDNFQTGIQTIDARYPITSIRYDQQHTWSPDVPEDDDIYNKRAQANTDYRYDEQTFDYGFSHIRSENVISNLTSRANRHLFRWTGSGRMLENRRLTLTGRYSFNRGALTNEVKSGDRALDIAPIATGLYALDDTPDQGALGVNVGLADGNKVDPVIPTIDMGGGSVDHNLGADLGIARNVAAIYIYTDRPSGTQPRWEAYGSTDNFTWQPLSVGVQLFNPAFNRYELSFPAEEYRYVKAVNTGLNEIAVVLVAEIEVLLELPPGAEETTFANASHSVDGRVSYRFNERWESSLELSLQADENLGREGDKTNASVGWRAAYDQSETVTHHLRLGASRQAGDGQQQTILENVAGYTLNLDPLQTLTTTFSVSDRLNHLDGRRSQNVLSAVVEGNAAIYPDLNVTLGGSASQLDDYFADRRFRTWGARTGLDAALSDDLDLIVDYNYNETRGDGDKEAQGRRFASLGVDWRLTRDIYLRSSVRYDAQRTASWTQDHLVSWNLNSKLRISAQLFEIETDDVTTSFRRSAVLNWDLGTRSSLYLRVAEVDFSGVGGTRTESFQQGFRTSF